MALVLTLLSRECDPQTCDQDRAPRPRRPGPLPNPLFFLIFSHIFPFSLHLPTATYRALRAPFCPVSLLDLPDGPPGVLPSRVSTTSLPGLSSFIPLLGVLVVFHALASPATEKERLRTPLVWACLLAVCRLALFTEPRVVLHYIWSPDLEVVST